jgi:hypothetical protein
MQPIARETGQGDDMFFKLMNSATRRMVFDAPGEGKPGEDAAAIAAAAAAAADQAAAALAAEQAAAAKVASDEAAAVVAAEAAAAAAKLIDPNDTHAAEKATLLREIMDKKARAKALEVQLQAYDGVDPDRVRALIKKDADAQTLSEEAKGNYDRAKEMMATEHEKDVTALNARIAELEASDGTKAKTIDDLTVGSSFGNSPYIREEITLSPAKARALYGAHFEMSDGQIVGFDKPASSANRTMLINSSGLPLVFEEAMKRIIEADPDAASMMRAKVKPGSSSKTEPGAPIVPVVKTDSAYGASRIVANLENL